MFEINIYWLYKSWAENNKKDISISLKLFQFLFLHIKLFSETDEDLSIIFHQEIELSRRLQSVYKQIRLDLSEIGSCVDV